MGNVNFRANDNNGVYSPLNKMRTHETSKLDGWMDGRKEGRKEGKEGKGKLFLTEKCQLINAAGMMKIENHHLATIMEGVISNCKDCE